MMLLAAIANADGYRMRGRTPLVPEPKSDRPKIIWCPDKAIYRRVIKQHIAGVTRCYESALLRDPSLAGTVNVRFLIGTKGKVHYANAAGVSPDLAVCVGQAIAALEFPRGPENVTVDYPFTFRR